MMVVDGGLIGTDAMMVVGAGDGDRDGDGGWVKD